MAETSNGSRLIWTPAVPGEEVKFLRSASDRAVALTPKLMGWWVVTFRGRHLEMIVRAARLARLTGDARYDTWARGQLDFYADSFECWPPARDGARLFGQTLTEATTISRGGVPATMTSLAP